jgi:hypothetical protein
VLPVRDDSEITVNINEAILGNSRGDFTAEQLLSAIEHVNAMNNLGFGLREALRNRCFVEHVPRRSRNMPSTVRSLGRPQGSAHTASTKSSWSNVHFVAG